MDMKKNAIMPTIRNTGLPERALMRSCGGGRQGRCAERRRGGRQNGAKTTNACTTAHVNTPAHRQQKDALIEDVAELAMSQAEGPKAQVGGGVGHSAEYKLYRVDDLVHENLHGRARYDVKRTAGGVVGGLLCRRLDRRSEASEATVGGVPSPNLFQTLSPQAAKLRTSPKSK
jgi:hypothetical protein